MNAATNVSDAPLNRMFATVAVMLATLMYTLDTTIANVALPHMQGSLGASQEHVSWVLTSYIVASAITMPLTGFVAGRLGRRRLFIICVIGFTLLSMLCGAAQNIGQIVLFRMLQGVFGAALVPLSQSVLLDIYPKEKHGQAMAIWGMGVMIGPILGPTLGGWLTEYYSWRWVFYINIPFGCLAWFGLSSFLSETTIDKVRRFDMLGFIFLSVAIGAFQLMLDRGQTLNWFDSIEIILECGVGILSLYLFIAHICTSKDPFVEPALFVDRNFSVGLIFVFAIGILLLATMALLPPYLQRLGGYPVVDVGFILAPRGFGVMMAMMFVGKFSGKFDPRYNIFVGVLLISYSLALMTEFTNDMAPYHIVITGLMQGVGIGLTFGPLSNVTFSTLAQKYRNDGASFSNLIRSIGSSIGISIVTANLVNQSQANHAAFSQFVNPFNPAIKEAVEKGVYNLDSVAGLAKLDGYVNEQALTLAYLQDFRLMMWVSLATLPLLLLMRGVKLSKTSS